MRRGVEVLQFDLPSKNCFTVPSEVVKKKRRKGERNNKGGKGKGNGKYLVKLFHFLKNGFFFPTNKILSQVKDAFGEGFSLTRAYFSTEKAAIYRMVKLERRGEGREGREGTYDVSNIH